MIEIDGSYGEGGGQILRTAVALASITGEPIRVINIRAKRSNPGLRPQHLTGIKAAAKITNGRAEGLFVGSMEIKYYPGKIRRGEFFFDIGTAGSISLLLQTLLPICAFSNGEMRLRLRGGTDVSKAPSIDYYRFVYSEILKRLGFFNEIEVLRRGYYPRGGGEVVCITKPIERFEKIEFLERKVPKRIFGIAHASENLRKRRVCERMIEGAKEIIDFEEKIEYSRTLSTGCGITLICDFGKEIIGSCELGERGVPAEEVGRKCAIRLKEEIDYPVDKHLADHLVVWIALFGGKFRTSEITMHTRTNIWVCEKILGVKFDVDEEKRIIEVKRGYFD